MIVLNWIERANPNPIERLQCLTKHDSYSGKHVWRAAPCDVSCYPDGAVADEIVRRLKATAAAATAAAAGGGGGGAVSGGANGELAAPAAQPFFLAVGFKRPHLGWMGPSSFFDKYNVSNVAIAKHRTPPAGTTQDSFGGNGEMCGMSDATCAKRDG
jgi:hypothetical protein